jgi:UrcA family protein
MFRIVLNASVAGLVCVSALTGGEPAKAQTVALEYSAAELASPAGIAALYDRIRRRSRAACETMSGLTRLRARHDCRDALVADLVAGIGHPELTALAADSESRLAMAER